MPLDEIRNAMRIIAAGEPDARRRASFPPEVGGEGGLYCRRTGEEAMSYVHICRLILIKFLFTDARCWIVLAMVAGGLSDGGNAQSVCDQSVPQDAAQTSGYRQRDDRCEGKYKRNVSSFGVQLVSLTAGAPLEDLCGSPTQVVHLVWPAPGTPNDKPVRLQVESLRRGLEYRLNTIRPAQSSSYAWPQEPRCNADVKLRGPEIGLLARTEVSLGSTAVDVLLPVALSVQPAARVRPPYRAVLVPGRRIHEIYVSLWYYEGGKKPVDIVLDRPLAQRPYPPAGGQIPVVLSAADVNRPGLYRLLINVEFDSGEKDTINRYFIGE
jgi:hypothetical protein